MRRGEGLGDAGRYPVVFQAGEKDKDAQLDTFAFLLEQDVTYVACLNMFSNISFSK